MIDAAIQFTGGDFQGFLKAFKAASGFDPESFFQLYKDTDENTVLKILARFYETLSACLEQTQVGFRTGDAEKIWKASHKIAGSAELLGFREFGEAARNLSLQVRANPLLPDHQDDHDDFVALAKDLKNQIARACPHLSEYLF